MDETYIRMKGRWAYLCRAVDTHGDTIKFHLSSTWCFCSPTIGLRAEGFRGERTYDAPSDIPVAAG